MYFLYSQSVYKSLARFCFVFWSLSLSLSLSCGHERKKTDMILPYEKSERKNERYQKMMTVTRFDVRAGWKEILDRIPTRFQMTLWEGKFKWLSERESLSLEAWREERWKKTQDWMWDSIFFHQLSFAKLPFSLEEDNKKIKRFLSSEQPSSSPSSYAGHRVDGSILWLSWDRLHVHPRKILWLVSLSLSLSHAFLPFRDGGHWIALGKLHHSNFHHFPMTCYFRSFISFPHSSLSLSLSPTLSLSFFLSIFTCNILFLLFNI